MEIEKSRKQYEEIISRLENELLEEKQNLAVAVYHSQNKMEAFHNLQSVWKSFLTQWNQDSDIEINKMQTNGVLKSDEQFTLKYQKLSEHTGEDFSSIKNDIGLLNNKSLKGSNGAFFRNHVKRQFTQEKKYSVVNVIQTKQVVKECGMCINVKSELEYLDKRLDFIEAELTSLKFEEKTLLSKHSTSDQQLLQKSLEKNKEKQNFIRNEIQLLLRLVQKIKQQTAKDFKDQSKTIDSVEEVLVDQVNRQGKMLQLTSPILERGICNISQLEDCKLKTSVSDGESVCSGDGKCRVCSQIRVEKTEGSSGGQVCKSEHGCYKQSGIARLTEELRLVDLLVRQYNDFKDCMLSRNQEVMQKQHPNINKKLTKLECDVQELISHFKNKTESYKHNKHAKIFSEDIKRNSTLHYGTGMAYSYFYGYLNLILSAEKDGVKFKGIKKRITNYINAESLCSSSFPVKKLFILIPLNLDTSRNLLQLSVDEGDDGKYWMEAAKTLEPVKLDIMGVIGRLYQNHVYKIKDPNREDSKNIYVVAAVALKSFHDVVRMNPEISHIFRRHEHEVTSLFCQTLQEIIRDSNECRDLCEIILYAATDKNGRRVNVARLILDRIQKIV